MYVAAAVYCTTSGLSGEDLSVAVGESCFTFEIASCQDGCNFNEAEQVCRGKGGKLVEPESKEIAAKIVGAVKNYTMVGGREPQPLGLHITAKVYIIGNQIEKLRPRF